MPKSNYSDSVNQSLTSDEEELAPIDQPVPDRVVAHTATPNIPTTPKGPIDVEKDVKANSSRQSTGLARFRAVARTVIRMHTVANAAGREPGVDVRKTSAGLMYGHLHQRCEIEVIDYNRTTAQAKKFDNHSFKQWIQTPEFEKESWVKTRWINVGGLSWDVVRELGIKHPLHPLAVEDLLSDRRIARSKAEYFAKHLFLRVVCHELNEDDPNASIISRDRRTLSPSRLSRKGRPSHDTLTNYDTGNSSKLMQSKSTGYDIEASITSDISTQAPSAKLSSNARKLAVEKRTLEELKKGESVDVALRNMCIFFTTDGTIISFYTASNLDFTASISSRLKQRESGLRLNPDGSMLIHALLDLIVDKAMQVMDAYQGKILSLEKITLMKPKMSTVRSLHVISGDLILHKRTMEPLKQLCYGLRRYDLDRCIALAEDLDPGCDKARVRGFMSHKAKIYLADVVDHVDHILSSMDMFSATAENLINYTFNVNSTQTNQVMKIFTIVTIVCLPLTLLTGYFGMNFVRFNAVQLNSDALFWAIALPILFVVVLLTLWSEFHSMYHHIQKKMFVKETELAYQK